MSKSITECECGICNWCVGRFRDLAIALDLRITELEAALAETRTRALREAASMIAKEANRFVLRGHMAQAAGLNCAAAIVESLAATPDPARGGEV